MAIVVSIGALLASVFLLVTGNGLLGITLAVRMNDGETSAQLIGLVLACYSVGFVSGALLAGRIVSRVGHIRSFAACSAFACTSVLLHSLEQDLIFWAVLRVITGFSTAAMFMVTESWLNERATNAVRGLMLSVYMVTNFSAAGIGQFLLNAAPIQGSTLFMIAAILTVLSLVPLALTTSEQPTLPERRRFGLVRLYHISPLGLVGAAAVGVATGSFGSMGPVFAERVGLSIDQVSLYMGFGLLAGLVLQFPIGMLSDRMDRRHLILGANAVAGILGVAIYLVALLSDAMPFLAVLLLTCASTSVLYLLYPLCVAHANDFAASGETTGVAGGLLMIWGAGTILGPIVGSGAMALIGPAALWLLIGVISFATAGYAGWRMSRRPTVEEVVPFAPTPVLATPVATVLDPRVDLEAELEAAEMEAAATADAGTTGAADAETGGAGDVLPRTPPERDAGATSAVEAVPDADAAAADETAAGATSAVEAVPQDDGAPERHPDGAPGSDDAPAGAPRPEEDKPA